MLPGVGNGVQRGTISAPRNTGLAVASPPSTPSPVTAASSPTRSSLLSIRIVDEPVLIPRFYRVILVVTGQHPRRGQAITAQ